ncbi:MAG: EamA/RhaT family transporter [Gammaproteobacteria bacterium]|nr:EamA/RhaT family transporter [Gammaproteobacteria bacterium]
MPMPAEHLWIPITLFAAAAQTVRNAAQKHLTASLGTLGATLVRFLYGLPFALTWLAAVALVGGHALPQPNPAFAGWLLFGAVSQIGGTAFLLRAMQERNFTLGLAYAKTEALQVAFFGALFLADPIGPGAYAAALCGTLGVMLMSPIDRERPLRALVSGWTSRAALCGLASGTCFGFSAVGYRGAALALPDTPFVMAAAFGLLLAQSVQTMLLGGWLLARTPAVVGATLRAWRSSLVVGCAGASASAGWFTAMAIEPIAHVRTLALVELFFAYLVSRKLFREKLTPLEMSGVLLLGAALVIVTLGG